MENNTLNIVSEFDQVEILLESVIKYSKSTETLTDLNDYRDELEHTIRAHKALKNKCDADVDKERYKAIEEALVRELRLFKDKGYEVIESTVSTLTSM